MKLTDVFLSGAGAVAMAIVICATAQATRAATPGPAIARTPVAAAAQSASPQPAAGRLDDLPLTVRPAGGSGDTLAVIYSGDGGWVAIDDGLAAGFVRSGIPVVGYDSLRYFWTARTPEGAAADLTAVLRRYMAQWGKKRILLTGYSFGADALPVIIPHLPADLRSRIRLVALVGVSQDGRLEFRPGDWLNVGGARAFQVAPAIAALKGLSVMCIYGEREKDAACPTFPARDVRAVRLSGGHHYDGAFSAVTDVILGALLK